MDVKPEVRKAGGVYYTPRYIVEQTMGKLVEGTAPEKTLALRILDPACGSGSFLILWFEGGSCQSAGVGLLHQNHSSKSGLVPMPLAA